MEDYAASLARTIRACDFEEDIVIETVHVILSGSGELECIVNHI